MNHQSACLAQNGVLGSRKRTSCRRGDVPRIGVAVIIALCICMVSLLPQRAFAWGETKHPIEELLVQRMYLDDRHVFCGSSASWGTNRFGLFVFDRETETWKNYCAGDGFPANSIRAITEHNGSIDVVSRLGVARFDPGSEEYQVLASNPYGRAGPKTILELDEKTYTLSTDSLIEWDGEQRKVYNFPSAPPLPSEMAGRFGPRSDRYGFSFSQPVIVGNRIFFAYDRHGEYGSSTFGVGHFDIHSKAFEFLPSSIFQGNATDCFISGASIVFATARHLYEGNARPAAGFVEFVPKTGEFRSWEGLQLPGAPRAIFCVEQDETDYWIGTDRGVFRIDKEDRNCTHYAVRKAVMPRDGVNVHAMYGDLHGSNQYPVVTELAKGATVDLLGVYDAWCEIDAPCRIDGYIPASVVGDGPTWVTGDRVGSYISIKQPRTQKTAVKVRSSDESNTLLMLGWENPPKDAYRVTGRAGRLPSMQWYQIEIPTAWVSRDCVSFVMEKVDSISNSRED